MRRFPSVWMAAVMICGVTGLKAAEGRSAMAPPENEVQSSVPVERASALSTDPHPGPGTAKSPGEESDPEVPGDALATVLGQVVRDRDCTSRRLGVGSVEVGLHLLIHRILVEDLCRSKNVQLSADDIRNYQETVRQIVRSPDSNVSDQKQEPVFQEVTVRFRIEQLHQSVNSPAVPMLERLALHDDERALRLSLELRSELAVNSWRDLWPLRTEETLYKAYGGKIVARQLGFQAAGAFQKLVEEAREDGRLRFHDPLLERAFEERVQRDLSYREVPSQAADFSVPVWILVAGAESAKKAGSAESPANDPVPDAGKP